MEAWQIIASMYGAVLGYLCLSNIQQGKQIAVLTKTVDNASQKIDNISERFDLFTKTEIDTFKEIISKIKQI